jgi:hypothetical protein
VFRETESAILIAKIRQAVAGFRPRAALRQAGVHVYAYELGNELNGASFNRTTRSAPMPKLLDPQACDHQPGCGTVRAGWDKYIAVPRVMRRSNLLAGALLIGGSGHRSDPLQYPVLQARTDPGLLPLAGGPCSIAAAESGTGSMGSGAGSKAVAVIAAATMAVQRCGNLHPKIMSSCFSRQRTLPNSWLQMPPDAAW